VIDERGSHTAERVAIRRAAHQLLDRPPILDDPLALRIIAPESARELHESLAAVESSPLSPFLRAFFAIRSRFAEDTLAAAVRHGVSQYIVLGAGYDTFAYRNPFAGLRVFEVDHPATQARKRERLAAAAIEIPRSATLVGVDLAATPLLAALAAAGFDAGRAAFVSWLGVTVYLEMPAIDATLQAVASLPAGTAIVFDYGVPPESLEGRSRAAVEWMRERVARVGEPWKTFFTPQDLRERLHRVGFHQVDDFGPRELTDHYLRDRADDLRLGAAAHIARASV
jgi:methyltransferase (TIGR00027 family)